MMRIRANTWFPAVSLLLLLLLLARATGRTGENETAPLPEPAKGDYVLLAWSDRGMHFMNRDHSVMSLMPPHSTLRAQVVHRWDTSGKPAGSPGPPMGWPRIETKDLVLEYSIPGNTSSADKINFWDHAEALYGKPLAPDTGLTGRGLTGTFEQHQGYFEATGIPLTPFPDDTPDVEHAYQKALVVLKDLEGNVLATSTPTLPVSVEMNCTLGRCHDSDEEIVESHPEADGYDPDQRPMLCGSCHAQQLVGLEGETDAGSLSEVIHASHAFIDSSHSHLEGCYTCHPGPEAQHNRGIMGHQEGILCLHCHGWIEDVAHSIAEEGRQPWVEQPGCDDCHPPPHEGGGQQTDCDCFFTGGHFGLMCGGCHNSMHAIWPSREMADNDNVIALQGHAASLFDCDLCHTLSRQRDPEFGHSEW